MGKGRRPRKNKRKPRHPQGESAKPLELSTETQNPTLSNNGKTGLNPTASLSRNASQVTTAEKEAKLKEKIKAKHCRNFVVHEGLLIGKLEMVVEHKDDENKVQKVFLGKSNNLPTKVILLVGATGTGKTTLINAMANYMLGVDFADEFRFTVIDQKEDEERSEAWSQTDYITAFTFYNTPGMPFKFNYVLVDTPGFGDTRGINRDRKMMTQIELFLKQNYGIDQVDGVGFVVPASATRLTQTQIYVLDGLSSMFGKDIKNNIFIMATFSDARKPPIRKALAELGMTSYEIFRFNNSALYARNKSAEYTSGDESESDDEETITMSKKYWELAVRSMNNFFKKLGQMLPVSLTLTKEVLEERRHLQAVLFSLQIQVKLGLDKLSSLNQERQFVARLDDDIQGCRNYHIEVSIPEIKEIHLNPEECVTNCLKCNFSCHYPCYLPPTQNKERCAVMLSGSCKICVGSCGWEMHKHMEFRYKTVYKTEIRTAEDVLRRYSQAVSGKQTKQEVIRKMEDDINSHAKGLIKMIKSIQNHVERLEEIALKPNPLSTKEYLDLMVESEKLQKRPNFEKRIEMLLKLKEEVQILEAATGVVDNIPQSGEALLEHFQDLIVSGNENNEF